MAQRKDEETGKWYYYGYVSINGTKKHYKERGFDTRREARVAEEQRREEILNTKESITVNKLCELYLEHKQGKVKESTIYKDKKIIKKWCEKFNERKVSSLTPKELQSYIDDCDNEYKKRYVEKIFFTFNSVLKHGIKFDLISTNPLEKVELSKRPNEIEEEMKFWEPSVFNRFIQYVDDPMWKVLFMTLFFMGIRKGEAMALMWKDINFENKTMRIEKTTGAQERTKKIKYTPPKTNNSYRTITMPNTLCDVLWQWKQVCMTFSGFNEECFVFGHDLPIPAETLRRNFDDYIALANENLPNNEQIERIRIHDLRHSHASYLINNMSNKFTDFDIAKRLGDTVETLHKTYAHWFKRKDENIIDFMNNDTEINAG